MSIVKVYTVKAFKGIVVVVVSVVFVAGFVAVVVVLWGLNSRVLSSCSDDKSIFFRVETSPF